MAFQTIPANDRISGPFVAGAGQTVFNFDFPAYQISEVDVMRLRAGTMTVLAVGGDYTIALDGNGNGGMVTLIDGALAGDVITISGDTSTARETAFDPRSDFTATEVNRQLNRMHMLAQESRRDLASTVRAPVGETLAPLPPAGMPGFIYRLASGQFMVTNDIVLADTPISAFWADVLANTQSPADLKTSMTLPRNIGDFPGANFTIKFLAAIEYLSTSQEGVNIGAINAAGPGPNISPTAAFTFCGQGLNRTNFLRTSGSGTIFSLGPQHNGSRISDFGLSTSNVGGGAAILVASTALSAASVISLSGGYYTAGVTNGWDYILRVNGALKNVEPSGVRGMDARNLQIFGAAIMSVDLDTCHGFWGDNLGVYSVGGTGVGSGSIRISSTAISPTTGLPLLADGNRVSGTDVNGIYIDNTIDTFMSFNSVAGPIQIGAGSFNTVVEAIGHYNTKSVDRSKGAIIEGRDYFDFGTPALGGRCFANGWMEQWVEYLPTSVSTHLVAFFQGFSSVPRDMRATCFGSGTYATAFIDGAGWTTATFTALQVNSIAGLSKVRVTAVGRRWGS